MQPFLRPANAFGRVAKPAPDGWITEPIGVWRARRAEVVYDPQEHQVAVLRGNSPGATVMLANAGWARRGQDGNHEWWTRDLTDHLRRRLDAVGRSRGGLAVAR